MIAFVAITAVGLGSYAFRAGVAGVLGGRRPPAWLERWSAFVAPAAFAALAATGLAARSTTTTSAVPTALAVGAAVVAVRRTGSARSAVVAGMLVVWLASAVS